MNTSRIPLVGIFGMSLMLRYLTQDIVHALQAELNVALIWLSLESIVIIERILYYIAL